MTTSFLRQFARLTLILLALSSAAGNSFANEGGSKEGGAFSRLEPFTVNLSEMETFLQVVVTLKTAAPDADARIKAYMPIIRHQMIVLLSGKSGVALKTTEGKEKLMEEGLAAVNKVISRSDKDGVSEMFFESFIIQ